jgi:hypothetical protein
VVAHIESLENGNFKLWISDGAYLIPTIIQDEENKTCEAELFRFVKIGKIHVG